MSIDKLLYGFESQEFSTSFHSGDVASFFQHDDRIKIVTGCKIVVMAWERCDRRIHLCTANEY